jgi:PhnB protein
MKLSPYLNFDGKCETAFKFYEQCLGGKIDGKMTYGESPMANEVPPDWHDKVMHIQMTVGNQSLMGSDNMPEYFEEAKGTSILIYADSSAQAEQFFNALSENGTIKMPIQETFWAARFGMLVDQFGIPWMVNCDLGR